MCIVLKIKGVAQLTRRLILPRSPLSLWGSLMWNKYVFFILFFPCKEAKKDILVLILSPKNGPDQSHINRQSCAFEGSEKH